MYIILTIKTSYLNKPGRLAQKWDSILKFMSCDLSRSASKLYYIITVGYTNNTFFYALLSLFSRRLAKNKSKFWIKNRETWN